MLSVIESLSLPIGQAQTPQSDHPIFKFKKNNSLTKDQINQINQILKSKTTQITESDNQHRKNLKKNLKVKILKKEDQRTTNYTIGEIEKILTNKRFHPHGIKVKLKSGEIGRVQEILE